MSAPADQSRLIPRASREASIDRDALLSAIRECAPVGMELRYDGTEDKYAAAYVAGVQAAHDAADRILALVRPVEGVTLSLEEIEWLRPVLRSMLAPHPAFVIEGLADKVSALASRLEASA